MLRCCIESAGGIPHAGPTLPSADLGEMPRASLPAYCGFGLPQWLEGVLLDDSDEVLCLAAIEHDDDQPP